MASTRPHPVHARRDQKSFARGLLVGVGCHPDFPVSDLSLAVSNVQLVTISMEGFAAARPEAEHVSGTSGYLHAETVSPEILGGCFGTVSSPIALHGSLNKNEWNLEIVPRLKNLFWDRAIFNRLPILATASNWSAR
jgi:hypothetical protein